MLIHFCFVILWVSNHMYISIPELERKSQCLVSKSGGSRASQHILILVGKVLFHSSIMSCGQHQQLSSPVLCFTVTHNEQSRGKTHTHTHEQNQFSAWEFYIWGQPFFVGENKIKEATLQFLLSSIIFIVDVFCQSPQQHYPLFVTQESSARLLYHSLLSVSLSFSPSLNIRLICTESH